MQAQYDSAENRLEEAGYLEVSGAHLYTVLHEVPNPAARLLLVGPFASERHSSYVPWVRWARFLAARGIETLRYDYRGVGESTGAFEDMSFADWTEDVKSLAGWLKGRSPDAPLILHGLECGALLASKAFAMDIGNALLLWAPPANANEVLRTALLRRLAVEQAFKAVSERKPVSDYIRRLETGQSLEVEGYEWSGRLWSESFQFELPLGKDDEANAVWARRRPVRVAKLGRSAAPLVKGSSLGFISRLNPDLSALFASDFEWIANVPAAIQGKQ